MITNVELKANPNPPNVNMMEVHHQSPNKVDYEIAALTPVAESPVINRVCDCSTNSPKTVAKWSP